MLTTSSILQVSFLLLLVKSSEGLRSRKVTNEAFDEATRSLFSFANDTDDLLENPPILNYFSYSPPPTTTPTAPTPLSVIPTVVPTTPSQVTPVPTVEATAFPTPAPEALPGSDVPSPFPVAPTAVPVAPTAVPIAPTQAPVLPTPLPVAPTPVPVAPTPLPVAPTSAPVSPTTAPVAPTQAPVTPTASTVPSQLPVVPTFLPVVPTPSPVAPTLPPVSPTQSPVTPTSSDVPSPLPVAPTPVPVAPTTAAPVAPTAVPVAPTPLPVAPTPLPVAPTAVPVAPTAVPVAPTTVPVAPTAVPVAPTAAPLDPLLAELRSFIAPTDEDLAKFNIPTTPQAQALAWLKSDPINLTAGRSTRTALERYVLAVLYYSTSGPDWSLLSDIPYLSGTSACTWNNGAEPDTFEEFGVYCATGNQTSVDRVVLNESNLIGPLPWELVLLTNLVAIVLDFNEVSGTIPSRITELTKLELFWALDTSLSGSLPAFFSPETYTIDLGYNQLMGSIPETFGTNMPKLMELLIAGNAFTGTIPSSLGQIPDLVDFEFVENSFTGSVDSFLCTPGRIWETLRADCQEVTCSCCTEC